MRSPSYQLTPQGPPLGTVVQVEELIQRITASAQSRKARRPTLEAWSFRIETQIHKDLARAAKRMDPLAMSDIVNGLLELFLPLIIAQRELPGAPGAPGGVDAAQKMEIAAMLTRLSTLLGAPPR